MASSILIIVGCTFSTALAAPYVPPGSYKNSCRAIYTKKGKLFATCRTQSGRWVVSNIHYGKCQYGIVNQNGILICHPHPAKKSIVVVKKPGAKPAAVIIVK